MIETLVLARIQFAANITFHILFPTITIALGWVLLYGGNDLEGARQNYQQALEYGGTIWFRVHHDHQNGSFRDRCLGDLGISRDTVQFLGQDPPHNFKALRNTIKAFNLPDEQLARQVLRSDDVVDALYHQIVQDMLGMMETDGHRANADLSNIMIAKNLVLAIRLGVIEANVLWRILGTGESCRSAVRCFKKRLVLPRMALPTRSSTDVARA